VGRRNPAFSDRHRLPFFCVAGDVERDDWQQDRALARGRRGGTAGYLCGQIVHKGPFRFFGTPLPGWGTPVMGPVANPQQFDQRAFLQALADYCRGERIHLLEMCCPWLDGTLLREAGFRAAEDVTFSIALSTKEAAWKNIRATTRNYVRQAEKSGLVITAAEDEQAVYEHYRQLEEVFTKWLSRPPYSVERPLAIWRHLDPTQRLLLRAMRGGRCIATYLLVHDQHTMWGLATASYRDALQYHPNDLIHWRAIATACELGLQRFDLCGGGEYKRKHGAVRTPRIRWIQEYSRLASFAYRTAEKAWRTKRAIVMGLALWKRKRK
jgi:hypothetical protein